MEDLVDPSTFFDVSVYGIYFGNCKGLCNRKPGEYLPLRFIPFKSFRHLGLAFWPLERMSAYGLGPSTADNSKVVIKITSFLMHGEVSLAQMRLLRWRKKESGFYYEGKGCKNRRSGYTNIRANHWSSVARPANSNVGESEVTVEHGLPY